MDKLDAFKGRITIIPGATNDDEIIKESVAGCDGVLTILVPWGILHYSTGTAQAVLDHARPDARLIFSCGWHITRDGKDVYSITFKTLVKVFGWIARLVRFVDIDDQVEACRRVFASDARWTVVRGSDLEEGESQGLPVWSRHVGDRKRMNRPQMDANHRKGALDMTIEQKAGIIERMKRNINSPEGRHILQSAIGCSRTGVWSHH
ncbi:MAG: hypothetical protein AAES65_01510 [Candidatus Thiodiazotropha sp. (ex. Lucinoma kazani)]